MKKKIVVPDRFSGSRLLRSVWAGTEGSEGTMTCPRCGSPPAAPSGAAPAWISVKDRLPETDCDVLAYRVGAGGLPSWIEIARCFTDQRTRQWVGHVTHWMPLPEPPKVS